MQPQRNDGGSGGSPGASGEKVLGSETPSSYPAIPKHFPSCVTSLKSITLSGPQFPHLGDGEHATAFEGSCDNSMRGTVWVKHSAHPSTERTISAARFEVQSAVAGSSSQPSGSWEGASQDWSTPFQERRAEAHPGQLTQVMGSKLR